MSNDVKQLNPEEVLGMSVQAGATSQDGYALVLAGDYRILQFAKLLVETEREKMAKMFENLASESKKSYQSPTVAEFYLKKAEAARKGNYDG